jgi:channel protein (hemolysin III family)
MGVWQALVDGFLRPCEPVSSMTHLGASLAAARGARPLIALGRDQGRTPVLALYTFIVVGSLAISGLFHSLERGGAARELLMRLDHYAIWLLIAAAFTVVHVIACRGFWRWGILGIVWVYGTAGICLQVLWWDTFARWPGLALYLGMGWIGIGSIIKLGRELGFAAVRPLIYGGLLFSAGALAQPMGLPVLVPDWAGPHELFHLAVMAGMFLHWRFVERLLQGERVLVVQPATIAATDLGRQGISRVL